MIYTKYDIQRLQQALAAAQAEIERLRAAIAMKNQAIDDMRDEILIRADKLAAKHAELAAANEQIEMLRSAIATPEVYAGVVSETAEKDFAKQIEQLRQQTEAQHKSYGEVIGRLNVAEAERDSWRRVAERIEGEKQEQAKQLADANEQVDALTVGKQAALDHYTELYKENEQLREELHSSEARFRMARTEREQLRQENQRLKAEVERLNDEPACVSCSNELEAQIAALKARIAEMEKTLNPAQPKQTPEELSPGFPKNTKTDRPEFHVDTAGE